MNTDIVLPESIERLRGALGVAESQLCGLKLEDLQAAAGPPLAELADQLLGMFLEIRKANDAFLARAQAVLANQPSRGAA